MKRKIYLTDGAVALAEYIQDEDDPALYACWNDPGTEQGFNMRQTRTYEAYCAWERPPGWGAIILRLCDETPIGSIGFVSENADLSIMLYPEYRGMGYGTRAFALGARYCAEALQLERVYAGCYQDNQASLKMLARCGFVPHPETDSRETHYLTGQETIQFDFVKDLR